MQRRTALTGLSMLGLALAGSANVALGQQTRSNPPIAGGTDQHPLRLAAYQEKPATQSEKTIIKTTEKTIGGDYKEISSFFNVREANVNVDKGEWELELKSGWETGNGGDDDIFLGMSLKYGVSQGTYVEIEVIPTNVGDGGNQGAGELELSVFHQWTTESDAALAFATWANMRIPSGDGSEKVDGELNGAITKSLGGKWRAHLNGYVMTANGAMGDGGDKNRRDFQWGTGVGLDYQCDEDTIGTINYVNRSADQNGNSNDSIIELGFARKIADGQHLKLAVDVDVSGRNDDIANVGAKLQWSIDW